MLLIGVGILACSLTATTGNVDPIDWLEQSRTEVVTVVSLSHL